MHELVAADSDADVADLAALGLEEHEVAGLELVELHGLAVAILVPHDARQAQAVEREDVLHQPAAVEAVGVGAAEDVGHAAKGERRAGDRVAVAHLRHRDREAFGNRRRSRRDRGKGKGCGRAPEDAQPEVTPIRTPTPAMAAARHCMG